MDFRRTLLSAALALILLAPLPAQSAPPLRPLSVPVHAWIVPDGSLGERCEGKCLKGLAARVRKRRGVRAAQVDGDGLRLQIVPGKFRSDEVIKGIVGMKVEMRLPFESSEIRVVPGAPFPPVAFLEGSHLVVEFNEAMGKAIEAATGFKPLARMRCVGKTDGAQANEAVLVRYEVEKRPPFTMVPFLAEADLDGDRRQDVYLRITGLPELIIFNRASGLKAVALEGSAAGEEIPRCDQTPTRFARGVQRSKIKCIDERTPRHAGDAIERVEHNRSNRLLMWSEEGFVTCEPLGEGALPPPPSKEDEE